MKIVNWKQLSRFESSLNKTNELSTEMTNADSSLILPTTLQEEMVVVGQSLQPAISNALNLSRISYNEDGNDPLTIKKNFEHNLSQEALYEAK